MVADLFAKIRFENVRYAYGGVEALKGVTFEVPDRAVTVLFGPAGGGKTTLIRLANRLNDLVDGARLSGRVLLDGEDVYAPGVDVQRLRRRVGMVFALPLPLPGTVRENVTAGPRLAGERDRARLDAILERSLERAALWGEVRDRLDDTAARLSGGQQQRLCIARSLAMEPEVLLLDEPTSGLDPISTARVEDSLAALKIGVRHRHRAAQRAAGRADRRPGRLLPDGGAGGVGRRQGPVHRPARQAHGGLRDGEVRLSMEAIRVERLDVRYGGRLALADVSASLAGRRITALIGPSGCGKSTFLRCLNRMNDTIANARVTGRVLLDGSDLYAPGVDVTGLRRRVGMVFQRPNPFPQSVFDNVAFGPRVLGTHRGSALVGCRRGEPPVCRSLG